MFECKQVAVVLFALTFSACGGGAKIGGGKQGAAEALFAASAPASKSGSLQSGLRRATASGNSKVQGAHGGTASITVDALSLGGLLGGNSDVKFTIQYDKFNDDGKHTLDGSMTYTLKTATGAAVTTGFSGKVDLAFVGKVTFTGEIEDYIDANVTQSVDFQQLGTKSGSVGLSLNGTVATSTEQHTYNNESLTVTAGQITKG